MYLNLTNRCIIWRSNCLTFKRGRTGVKFEDLGMKFTSAGILLQSDRRALIASEPQISISAEPSATSQTSPLDPLTHLGSETQKKTVWSLSRITKKLWRRSVFYTLSQDWQGFGFNIGLLCHFAHIAPFPSHLNHPPSLDLLISIHFGRKSLRNTCIKTHFINVGSQTKFHCGPCFLILLSFGSTGYQSAY